MGILSNRLKERGSDRCSQGNWGRDSDGELMLEAADEIERLREALRMIADGDVPRQHVLIWRTDGQYSKHDKCPHDKWMYDDCDECVASFARTALGEKE